MRPAPLFAISVQEFTLVGLPDESFLCSKPLIKSGRSANPEYIGPDSIRSTVMSGFSVSLDAIMAPADPEPIIAKS